MLPKRRNTTQRDQRTRRKTRKRASLPSFFLLVVCLSLETLFFRPHVEKSVVGSYDYYYFTKTTPENSPPKKRGRVFFCGYRIPMAEHIFPDYEYMGGSEREVPSSTGGDRNTADDDNDNNDNDILVIGMFGPPCKGGVVSQANGIHNVSEFSGKILFVNREPTGDAVRSVWNIKHEAGWESVADRVYQIGPYPKADADADRSSTTEPRALLEFSWTGSRPTTICWNGW